MPCKRNSPGNPCCSPCINCTGTTFEVEAVSFAGTWSTPASDDDSPSCPACPIPGTFIFANSVTKEQLLGTDATPSGEQQCYRSVRQINSYCQTLIYNNVRYENFFGQWRKTRVKIYAREWYQIDASFGAVRMGSGTRISAGLRTIWNVEFVSRRCQFTTVGTYATQAEAQAAELDAQCEFGAPNATYEEPAGVFWLTCEKAQVIRNLSFYDDIAGSGSCTPTVCGVLTHRSTTSERWFYNYGIFGNCTGGATETDTIIKWKKDVDGSTPVGGDFTSTQHYLFTDYPLNSISGNGALTGTVTGQEFKVYGPDGITLLATLKEPCWPTTPTVDVVCNVEEPPPPPDP